MRKKMFIKRLTAFLLATTLVVTGTGCGKKDGKKSEQVDISNCTYKEEEGFIPEEIKEVSEVFASDDNMYFLCNTGEVNEIGNEESEEEDANNGNNEYHLYAMDSTSKEVTEITLPDIAENEWISSMYAIQQVTFTI